MKNSQRLLNTITKMIDIELFYSITLNGELKLQGHFDRKTVCTLREIKFKNEEISESGFVQMSRKVSDCVIYIVLT